MRKFLLNKYFVIEIEIENYLKVSDFIFFCILCFVVIGVGFVM